MFDVFTMGDTAHIDTIFKFLPHTLYTATIMSKRAIVSLNKSDVFPTQIIFNHIRQEVLAFVP